MIGYQNIEKDIANPNMCKERKEKLEDLWAINTQLWEENEHLNEKVHMFNKRMAGMDKHIETYTKLLPLLKNTFE
jgi:hypothetical protein